MSMMDMLRELAYGRGLFDYFWGFVFNSFFIQLIIGELIFSGPLQKRSESLIKPILLAIACSILSSAIYVPVYAIGDLVILSIGYYLLNFVCSIVFLRIAFIDDMNMLFLTAVSGYMTQHISSQICQLALWGISPRDWLAADGSDITIYGIFTVSIIVITYLTVYYVFGKRSRKIAFNSAVRRPYILLSVAALFTILFLSAIRDEHSDESFSLMAVSRLFSLFLCFLLLYLRSYIVERSEMQTERELMNQMYEIRMQQFEQSKESIELINLKCHDLRHQIENWEKSGHVPDKEELTEIRDAIGIYDSVVKTGNDTLDTLLTEKSIFCEKHDIRLSTIVDGSKLDFMTVGDLCSLFGNAIENAIEAVAELPKEDRVISFQVREKNSMLVINVDNYYRGNVDVSGGLPKSTKGDDRYHGFGTRSIRRIARKYGGDSVISVDDMFHLTVMLPLNR